MDPPVTLPHGERAYVDQSKITDYLLSPTHPDGRSKAQFFYLLGFRIEEWQVLAESLRRVGTSNPVTSVVESPHGVRYTVDGKILTPDGRTPRVRTVWIFEPNSRGPRLITAHPL
jgi:hypothetical protein